MLDNNSQPLDIQKLPPNETLFALLKWSAIPGFSRHHWGTDFDIYDHAALPENYKLQLIPQEYESGGIFTKLNTWFDQQLTNDFFLPYKNTTGGVSPEPWHISYQPIAQTYFNQLSLELFEQEIQASNLLLKQEILQNSSEIFNSYIININQGNS